jgi:hypothetical protein
VRWFWAFLRFELGLARSLYLAARGRQDGVRAGVTPVTYHRAATGMWAIGLFATLVEIPLMHLIVPWRPVQLTLLVLGVWSLWLVAGFWASFRVRPYLVDATGIRLRHGPFGDRTIPWSQVTDVRPETVRTWKAGLGTAVTTEDGRLGYVVNGATNVALVLADGTEVHIGADDPAALLRALPSPRPSVPADRG